MDRPTIDSNFIYRMCAEREATRRQELEERVQAETRARKAQEDGFAAGMLTAQKAVTFKALKALAERYQNYLDPEYQPTDRQRLQQEWFSFKEWIPSPEPDSESWRIGYARGVIEVFRTVDK